MSLWDRKQAKILFQKLPFYNVLIEKPHIKHLKNIDLLHELPFCEGWSIVRTSKAFKRYAGSYKLETEDSKDPLVQLKVSQSSSKVCLEAY